MTCEINVTPPDDLVREVIEILDEQSDEILPTDEFDKKKLDVAFKLGAQAVIDKMAGGNHE